MDIAQILMEVSSELTRHGEVLDKLKSATPHWSSYLPSFVGLSSVAVALILGVKSMNASKRQLKLAYAQLQTSNELLEKELKATVIASGRREWVENLRKESANYLRIVDMARTYHAIAESFEGTDDHDDDNSLELLQEFAPQLERSKSYIRLMLNNTEDPHKIIINIMDEIHHIIYDEDGIDPKALNIQSDLFTESVSSALKEAWEEVKRLG